MSRTLADVMKRFGQAAVIGELMAGVILGPSVLGKLWPAASAFIFPHDPVVVHLIEGFAWVGVIMLLLHIALETDLSVLKGMGRTAAMVSSFGMVIPDLRGPRDRKDTDRFGIAASRPRDADPRCRNRR